MPWHYNFVVVVVVVVIVAATVVFFVKGVKLTLRYC